MKIKKSAITSLFLLSVAACSPISQQAQQDLAKPINCATARGDIRVLQSEKAHVASQILAGVTAIQPAGAVLSVASGTEAAKLEVASGEYNNMIDQKIAAIKQTCGV
jgi:hypothetical protein